MIDRTIDFLQYRRPAAILSAIVILAGIVSLVAKGGPNYGIDFAGGTLLQLQFDNAVAVQEVRDALKGTSHERAAIQRFGDEREVLIRTVRVGLDQMAEEASKGPDESSPDVSPSDRVTTVQEEISDLLNREFPENPFEVRRVEMVGPQVGRELRKSALMAIFAATIGLLGYITYRFEFAFGLGAIAALVHDTLVTVGIFSLLDKEFNIPIIAALLTIIGYSLNDTIVVFDRVRENERPMRNATKINLLNTSISQTMSRTILTSSTTLLVVAALFVFGGPVIHDFAMALLIGVICGTYSSIYVANPFLLLWDQWQGESSNGSSSRRKKSKKATQTVGG